MSSRTSSPHSRILSNHSCAMDPNSAACSFIHASMAGSRSTAPLNRSNSVLIVAPLSAFGIYGYIALLHEKRKGQALSNAPFGNCQTAQSGEDSGCDADLHGIKLRLSIFV